MSATRDELARRVRAFMDGALVGSPPEAFEALLLDLHAWQIAGDPVLAALTPRPATTWLDVPCVPVSLYKRTIVGTVKTGAAVVFRTSGTTGSGRGEHHLRATDLYDHGALLWARRCVPDMPDEVVALLEDPARAPDSSLSHMVAGFPRGTGRATWHVVGDTLDLGGLAARLDDVGPAFVATTGFALAAWLASDPQPLPAGCVLMVTGGFKGRRVALSEEGLHAAAAEALRPRRIVTEYGMTELSSQLWGTPGEAYLPPPWLRAVAVDPATGDPVPPGDVGQLRFYDLANLDSSVGVETLDHGVVHGDGAVSLLGRLPGAEARGCSLPLEGLVGGDG